MRIPFFVGSGIGGAYDWNSTTSPQTSLDGRPRAMPQGRVLGGSTVINGMLWNRGDKRDFRDWVKLGNPGWS